MSQKKNGWIGVDLDGTLALYEGWKGSGHVGDPVPLMLKRVKKWIDEGREVRIFTARVYPLNACIKPGDNVAKYVVPPENMVMQDAAKSVESIRAFCKEHIGQELAVTNIKDYGMIRLYDDRAIQVIENTGELVK